MVAVFLLGVFLSYGTVIDPKQPLVELTVQHEVRLARGGERDEVRPSKLRRWSRISDRRRVEVLPVCAAPIGCWLTCL
ncbi:MAG TPA: hypothetical protein VFY71_05275 [Planctomycetota bacterium]|nr:hypothetical protein [Planctomycetota bacterium]